MADPVDVPALRRTAYLLHGDWPGADRLVHRALADRPADHPAARAALVRCWRAAPPAAPAPGGPDLVRALAAMPARQRGCVVLRSWERCPAAETADLLGCSVADVHRDTAAGLTVLLHLRTGSGRKPE